MIIIQLKPNRLKKTLLFTIFFLFLISSVAYAETSILQEAKKGDVKAQNNLGNHYYDQKEFKQAFYWYEKAADQGYAIAQNNLGIMYQMGYGIHKNMQKSFYWYEQAQSSGDRPVYTQYALGLLYYDEKNYEKAIYWYERAAENENVAAQSALASLYFQGRDIPKDLQKAKKFYKMACENESQISCDILERLQRDEYL